MPGNDTSPESTRSEHKFLGKHSWRGKLFSNDNKIPKSEGVQQTQVNDIVDFLQTPAKIKDPSHQVSVSRPTNDAVPTSGPPLVPVTDDLKQATGFSRRKPPRRKGLHVTFETACPVIIGEGGDEAELPSLEVRTSQGPATSQTEQRAPNAVLTSRRYSPPLENGRNLRWSLRQGLQGAWHDDDEDLSKSPPSQMGSEGLDAVEPRHAMHAAVKHANLKDDLSSRPLQKEDSPHSPVSDTIPEGLSASYASYTQSPPSSPDVAIKQVAGKPGNDRLTSQTDIKHHEALAPLKPLYPDHDAVFRNSLTPIPSPQPPSIQAAQASSYNFPDDGSEGHPVSQVETLTQQSQALASRTRDQEVLSPNTSTNPPKKSPVISLRDVARGLGEDALNEFSVRVQRFNSIFRLSATANKHLDDVSFMQWIHAATWWFLKGRGELESAVRGRPGSRDRHNPGREVGLSSVLKQAYLDLAKGWWISTEILPSHRELKKYGNAGIGSLTPIVKSFGDSKLAELLEIHHAITSNMRALAMSMKRNNKMPPDTFEPQGLDARIWVETPRFASGVAGILAGKSPRSLLDDDLAGFASFPFPIGDTTRHFNYGSMFVDVILHSSDSAQGKICSSCVLTILRQRTDRELEVVLASQDGRINLVIQSHGERGPTWRDTRWQTESHNVVLRLADGLDLEIQFQELNFRSLWGIYDYTRRVRKDMNPRDAERVAFEATVRCVHYVDTPDAKAFPPDPVRSCDVLLFKKFSTLSGGSGRRRFYDGHRLVVVTPPSVKTLSSINKNLGKVSPMLFNFVRGTDGGPGLLLKYDAVGPTLVITFNDPSSRDRFQTLLDGTRLGDDEISTEAIPLKAIRIESSANSSPSTLSSSLNQWRWQKLRVINKHPRYYESGLSSTVLSENLRLWAQCEAGTYVDRINLGETDEHLLKTPMLIQNRTGRATDRPRHRQSHRDHVTSSSTARHDSLLRKQCRLSEPSSSAE